MNSASSEQRVAAGDRGPIDGLPDLFCYLHIVELYGFARRLFDERFDELGAEFREYCRRLEATVAEHRARFAEAEKTLEWEGGLGRS
jgi:hypothetical protein